MIQTKLHKKSSTSPNSIKISLDMSKGYVVTSNKQKEERMTYNRDIVPRRNIGRTGLAIIDGIEAPRSVVDKTKQEPSQQTPKRPVATGEREMNRELRPTRETDREEGNLEEKKREIEEEGEAEDYLDEMRRDIEEERRQKEREKKSPMRRSKA